jgi:hypothetical protein
MCKTYELKGSIGKANSAGSPAASGATVDRVWAYSTAAHESQLTKVVSCKSSWDICSVAATDAVFAKCRTEGVFCLGLSISKLVTSSVNRGQLLWRGFSQTKLWKSILWVWSSVYTAHVFCIILKVVCFFGHTEYTLIFIYMKLNMFQTTYCPSSGAQNCTSSLWFCIHGGLMTV